MFHRVDSWLNITSCRPLLTSLMHEGDRAQALQNATSRSTPPIRRYSTGNSPQEDNVMMMVRQQVHHSKTFTMTTSNVHPPALSPRTARRNMLQTELTPLFRQELLWKRQKKNAYSNNVNTQELSAVSIPVLCRAMSTNDICKGSQVEGETALIVQR